MKQMQRIVLASALALSSAAIWAAGPMMREGMWEMTIQSEMAGMPFKQPPMTMQHCYTPKDVADTKKMIEERSGRNGKCSMTDFSASGNTVSYSMTCHTEHGDSKATGSTTYSTDSYKGSSKMLIQVGGNNVEMTQNTTGKRIGDCKAS